MKKVGIWIDKKEAKIVFIEGEKERMQKILSEVEDFHPGGGSGSRMKGGPQDVVQDSKYLEREKHQLANFFNDIAKIVVDADDILVFGPAQTGEKLRKELMERPQFHNQKIALAKADSMSDNQIKAWVREFYRTAN